MESEFPSAGFVNEFRDENSPEGPSGKPRIRRGDIKDRRTFVLFLRFQGYLRGAFDRRSRGRLIFFDWDHGGFARATASNKPLSLKTIERQFPRFQRWCEEYRFAKIMVTDRRPGKSGRKIWRVRVTLNQGVQRGVPGNSIRERLVAAIRSHVAKAGRTKVDRVFCEKFASLTALPLPAIEAVWVRLEKGNLPELKLRWRGAGRGRKLCIEHPGRWAAVLAERGNLRKTGSRDPQTSRAVSISYGNERLKNSRAEPEAPEEPARAAPDPGEGVESKRSPPAPGLEPPLNEASASDRCPAGKPLQFCNRYVSERKLHALAVWMAVARLKFAHGPAESARVVWRFAHSRNFAERALRFGYGADEICAAYARGVARSADDALDRDRLPGGGYASQREPSAAVVYAWLELRGADPRSSEQLWAAFFARPRRGRLRPAGSPKPASGTAGTAAPKPARGAAPPGRAGGPRLSPAEAAARLAELRALVKTVPRDDSSPADAGEVTLGSLARVLESRGLSIGEFNTLPWRAKKWYVERARTHPAP